MPTPTRKYRDRKQGKQAFGFRTDDQPADKQEYHEQQAADGNEHPKNVKYLQRHDGKARHEIEVETNQIVERYFEVPAARAACSTSTSVGLAA